MSGISLHVGLNGVDPQAYNGWDGFLVSGINGADWMSGMARTHGFANTQYFNSQATVNSILAYLNHAVQILTAGDIFLFSFSGHGKLLSISSVNETEDSPGSHDLSDEAIALHDGVMIDNEIRWHLASFRPGVRIVFIADCCFSGDLIDVRIPNQIHNHPAQPSCSIKMFAAAQENGFAGDGNPYSVFMQALIRAFDSNLPNYDILFETIYQQVVNNPDNIQKPKYLCRGQLNEVFETQIPFTI